MSDNPSEAGQVSSSQPTSVSQSQPPTSPTEASVPKECVNRPMMFDRADFSESPSGTVIKLVDTHD